MIFIILYNVLFLYNVTVNKYELGLHTFLDIFE